MKGDFSRDRDADEDGDFGIGAGRYYVDGLLAAGKLTIDRERHDYRRHFRPLTHRP